MICHRVTREAQHIQQAIKDSVDGRDTRRTYRVLTTTVPHEVLDQLGKPYPPRVAWQIRLQTTDAMRAYELRDLLTASGTITAARIEVLP